MPKPENDAWVVPSVFDRLIDLDPKSPEDPKRPREDPVRAFRKTVERDLEQLLNTRNPHHDLSSEFTDVSRSTLAYGLPDLSSLNVSSPSDQQRMRQAIERALQAFEPRLRAVSVSLLPANQSERTMRLRVDAELIMDPVPEPVSFDVVMPLTTRRYEVKERD